MGAPGPTPTVTLQDVLTVFESQGAVEPLTASEVAEALDCTRRTAHKKLDALAEQGALESKKPGARSRVWWRPIDSLDGQAGADDSIQEIQFQELADQVAEYAIFVLDPNGHVETWNTGAEGIKGFRASEIVGEHISTFYTDEDRAANRPGRNLRAAAELGEIEDEGWRVRRDGSRFWANVTLTALTDEDGSLTGFVKVTRDMTERHDRQRKLEREKERFESLVSEVKDYAIFMLDREGRVRSWNEGAEKIKGYEEDEILGQHFSTFYTPEEREDGVPERNLQAALENERVEDEGWRVRKDGSRFWADVVITRLTDDAGGTRGFAKVTRDMTDRHTRRQELRREKERFESLVSEVKDYAIFMLDREGRVRSWNEGAEKIKGYEEDEILGQHFSTFYTDEDQEAGVPSENIAIAEAEGRTEDEGWRVRKDGSRFWADVVITRLTDDAGGTRGFAKVTRDMTERRKYEETLKKQRDELDELDRINAVIRDVDQTLVTADTRSGVESGVCDRLARSEPYDAAWVGEVVGSTIRARAVAGFDETTLAESLEGTDGVVPVERAMGQAALEDGEPQFVELDSRSDEFAHWADATAGSVPSVAVAIPLASDELQFGVLFVYSTDPEAFDDRKMDVLFELGKTISDTLTALRRKERERRLTALHRSTRDLVQTETASELGDTISATVVDVLGFRDAHVYRFDTADNSLHPLSSAFAVDETGVRLPVLSGQDDSVVWSCFVDGTTRVVAPADGDDQLLAGPDGRSELVVPLGEHGVIVAGSGPDDQIDSDDRHLVELVEATAEAAFDRFESQANLRERESILQDQNKRLQRLNQVNTVIRKVDQAIVQATTYEEILRVVCERLTTTDRFRFAWIGELHDGGASLDPVVQSGLSTDYLDAVSLEGDSSEPGVVAARTGSIQVVENVAKDLRAAPWRSEAFSREFQSCIAVPLTYGDVTYGVLAAYGDRPGTFGDIEESVFEELGTTIGNALNAVEAKFALLSDATVEVEFDLDRTTDSVLTALAERTDADVTYEGTIPSTDGSYRLFFSTPGTDPDAILDAATRLDDVLEASTVSTTGDQTLFEFTLTEDSLFAALARQNVTLSEFTVTEDGATVRVVVPTSADVSDFVDWFIETYPGVTFVARREHQGKDGPQARFVDDLSEYLTDRQYEVVKTAYVSGYFETPRRSTGSDVAETLGLSQPTVTEHIRAAQRRILDRLFET